MSSTPNCDSPRRRNRELETKVAKLLQAWLIYLDLAALVSAKVEIDEDNRNLWEAGIAIVGNSLHLEEPVFRELKANCSEARKQNSSFQIAVAFPKVYEVEKGKRQLQPLFTIDLSPIFEGNYHKLGWDLNQFEFQPVIPNLINVAEIDEEKTEQLVTAEGLHTFLADTFKLSFNTLQDFLQLCVLPYVPQTVQFTPYLLRFDSVPHNYHLKKDLKKILDQQTYWNWVYPGHPAFDYLFGRPQPPKHTIWYAGAFPTHVPTDAQSQVFKQLRQHPLVAAVGPPGCGKTTSMAHGIAMIVSDRALNLLKTGRDESNLALMTSTNNRAVRQLEKQLEEAGLTSLMLPGGPKKEVLRPRTLPQLQTMMLWLDQTPYDPAKQQATAEALRQKVEQLEICRLQDPAQQTERQNIMAELAAVEQQILTLQSSLAGFTAEDGTVNPFGNYSEFPFEAYEQLQVCLSQYSPSNQSAPPNPAAKTEPASNWFQRIIQGISRLWQRIVQRPQRTDFYDRINELAIETESTLFPIEFQLPLSEQKIKDKRTYISAQLRAAQSWQTIDRIEVNLKERTKRRSELNQQLAAYPERDFYSRFYTKDFHQLQQDIFQLSQEYLKYEALRRKAEVRDSLQLYSQILDGNDEDGMTYHKFSRQWRTVYRDLSLLCPVLVSTLHSLRNLLPFPDKDSLAYVFADEAGTTSLHQLFPALIRCQKALVVGDPMQLQPIVPFSKQRLEQYYQNAFVQQGLSEEDFHLYSPTAYESASAYQRAAGANGQPNSKGYGITLIDHFRCPEPLATLVDRLGNYGLSIKTTPIDPVLGSHLIATHVEGNPQNEVNAQEIDTVIAWVAQLYKLGYSFGTTDKKKTIAVISPYRKQANALRRALQKRWRDCNEDNTNTVHAFQGGQRAIVLFSTRQSQPTDSLLFLNRGSNLINVAVSRTTETFILVGNLDRLSGGSYSRMLVDHTRQYGEARPTPDSRRR